MYREPTASPGRAKCLEFSVGFGSKEAKCFVPIAKVFPNPKTLFHVQVKQVEIASDSLDFNIRDPERLLLYHQTVHFSKPLSTLVSMSKKPLLSLNEMTNSVPFELVLQFIGQPSPSVKSFLVLKVTYSTYAQLRRNFWLALLGYFGNETKSLNVVSLTTFLDTLGCTFSEESIHLFFIASQVPIWGSLPFETVIELLESHLVQDSGGESLTNILSCPFCTRRFENSSQLDTLSHISLCFQQDKSRISVMVLGGYIASNHVPKSWYTKLTIGAKSKGSVYCQERASGQLIEDTVPAYMRLGIRMVYQAIGSTLELEKTMLETLMNSMSNFVLMVATRQMELFDVPSSSEFIHPFITLHDIDLADIADSIDSFTSFNAFIGRKLKAGARTLASDDPDVLVAPADCRVVVYNELRHASLFWIKSCFSYESLLQNDDMAREFQGGPIACFRIAFTDCHRIYSPVDGTILSITKIKGQSYPCNVPCVRSPLDVFCKNLRTVVYVQLSNHGRICLVIVGGFMSPFIHLGVKEGDALKRLDEIGMVMFGNATVLLVAEEDACLNFDVDLADRSSQSIETIVKAGMSIASIKLD